MNKPLTANVYTLAKFLFCSLPLASKLLYVMNFYPIPKNIQIDIQKSIFQYLNFPLKVIIISQKEMWKTKVNGGIKLVNVQLKSETAKTKWLIEKAQKIQ